MRALVTGGAGFLAQYIVEKLLDKGYKVRSISRSSYPELVALGVECVTGDLRNKNDVIDACKDCDVVFHVAALAGLWGDYTVFYDINVRGTEHIIEGCRTHGVRKLVYTSSPSVVFPMGDLKNVNESQPYPEKFYSPYARSKAAAEKILLAANGPGLATCALRPHLIWGPRDTHILQLLIDRSKEGKLIQIGNGENLVDLTYVENAADAHLQAADKLEPGSPVGGKAYFITDGAPVNLWTWVGDFLKRMQLPPVKKTVAERTAMRIAGVMEALYKLLPFLGTPKLTRFMVSNFATSHYFDISAARNDFGYDPQVDNEEGLKRSVEWCKKHSI